MRATRVTAVLFLVGVATPVSAQQMPFQDALEAYRAGMLGQALESFERALRQPGNETGHLVTIHLHLAILRSSLGEADAARRSMQVALALSPNLRAPDEAPPDLRAMLEDVRAERAGAQLTVEAQSDTPGAVRAAVANAPAGLVRRLRLRVQGGGPVGEFDPSTDAPIRVATAQFGELHALTVVVEALDEHHGVLARAEVAVARPTSALDPPSAVSESGSGAPSPLVLTSDSAPADDDGGSVLSSPWLWITVGVLVAAGATATLLMLTADERQVLRAPIVEMR